MYIQITTKCNMACEHCGMNCDTISGEHMDFKTFKAALRHDDTITIGGGEPTVHPHFEKFLLYALTNCYSVFIITNGKLTDKALAIARLAEMDDERFGAELSQDPYHDPIDDVVIDAFKGRIRDTSRNLINAGRCDFGWTEDCICEEAIVKPNGDIHQCGCDDSPKVGTVFDDQILPLGSNEEDYGEWICHKKMEEMEEMED